MCQQSQENKLWKQITNHFFPVLLRGKKLHGAGFFQNKNEQVGLEGKENKVNKLQMKK
jgi:hypothetical protein